MAELPRYVATGQFQEVQPVSSAPSFSAISTLFGGIAKESGNLLQKEKQTALTQDKYNSATDVETSINAFKQVHANNMDGMQGVLAFKSQVNEYAKNYLPTVPKENRELISNLLNHQAMQGADELNNAAIKQSNAVQRSTFNENYDSSLNASLSAAMSGDSIGALSLAGKTQQMVTDEVKSGRIKGPEAGVYLASSRKQVASSIVLGQFQKVMTTGNLQAAQTAIDNFKKRKEDENDNILGPADKASLISTMNKQVDDAMRVHGADVLGLKAQSEDLVLGVRSGKTLDTNKMAALARHMSPAQADTFVQHVQEAQLYHSIKQQATTGTLGERDAKAEKLSQGNAEDAGAPGSAMTLAARQAVATDVKADNKEWRDNPGAAIQKVPDYNNYVDNQLNQIPSGSDVQIAQKARIKEILQNPASIFKASPVDETPAVKKTLNSIYSFSANYQRGLGQKQNDVTVVSQGGINSMVSTLNQLPIGQRVEAVGRMCDTMGPNCQNVMPRLFKAGVDVATNAGIRIARNPAIRPHLNDFLNAMAIPNAALKADFGAMSSTKTLDNVRQKVTAGMSKYIATVQASQGLNSTTLENLKRQATKYAAGLMVGDKNMSMDTASTQAVGDMFDSNYDYRSANGGDFRVPKGTDMKRFYAGQSMVTQDANKADLYVPASFMPRLENNKMREQLYKQENLSAPKLCTNPGDAGVSLCDSSGLVMLTKDRRNRFTVPFNLTDVASPFNKSLDASINSGKVKTSSRPTGLDYSGDVVKPRKTLSDQPASFVIRNSPEDVAKNKEILKKTVAGLIDHSLKKKMSYTLRGFFDLSADNAG